MTHWLRDLIRHLCRTDIKRFVNQFRSLIFEVKADIHEAVGHKSRISLRIPAGYNPWRVLWTVDEKARFHYPRLKQREHRPATIYNLIDNPDYRDPYFLPHQRGKVEMSFHLPFLANNQVIAEFVIYIAEELSQERVRRLRNTIEKYEKALLEMALVAHDLET